MDRDVKYVKPRSKMLRVVISAALLCASLHEASAENNAKISKEIKLGHPHSYTVAIDPHLLTIAKNSTHLLVNSTDSNSKPCAIALEEHTFQKRIEATVINRKIIVWGIRTKYETDVGDRIEHTVLIVDPWQCSFKVASTVEEERPSSWRSPEDLAQVVQVAEEDVFDVFYPSLKTCAPCRYSLDGKRIDLQHQLIMNDTVPRSGEETPFFRIQRYNAYNITGVNARGYLGYEWGYIFAYNFGNGSSVVKILDENFGTSRQRCLDHRTDKIAVDVNGRSDMFVCYMTKEDNSSRTANDSICCESFDERDYDMKSKYTIRLPMLEGYAPDTFSMNAMRNGELYVSVSQALPGDFDRKKFGLYWIRSSGTLMDSATFYQLPEDVSGRWKIRSFFSDYGYCIENTADDGGQVADHEFVKCALLRVTYRRDWP